MAFRSTGFRALLLFSFFFLFYIYHLLWSVFLQIKQIIQIDSLAIISFLSALRTKFHSIEIAFLHSLHFAISHRLFSYVYFRSYVPYYSCQYNVRIYTVNNFLNSKISIYCLHVEDWYDSILKEVLSFLPGLVNGCGGAMIFTQSHETIFISLVRDQKHYSLVYPSSTRADTRFIIGIIKSLAPRLQWGLELGILSAFTWEFPAYHEIQPHKLPPAQYQNLNFSYLICKH